MKGFFKHPLRVIARLIWLGFELNLAALNFFIYVLIPRNPPLLQARARWLQAGSRRVLRIFDAEILAIGPIPKNGLLISNHLSYLDILVLSALTPSIFVAKCEVRKWPVFGLFARLAGTLFADRERRTQVRPLAVELKAALDHAALVVLFPEGTSSDGRDVLPFKSALLEPATNTAFALAASCIQYELEDGDVAEEVCYWKDMTFTPHLLNLLSKKRIIAFLRFSELGGRSAERKELALQLHSEILRLKSQEKPSDMPLGIPASCKRLTN
jgi:1-acyl-sn-glycerol-3-phosphate acyltransferase